MGVLLLVLLALPFAAAVPVALLPPHAAVRCAQAVALGLLAGACVLAFRTGSTGHRLAVTDVGWVPALSLRLHVGVDGVSAPLLVLTALLAALCCVSVTRRVERVAHPGRLLALVLVLAGGVLATFAAQDLLLFFVAFEVVLLPMWALIHVWGLSTARAHAAAKFVLYTLAGSAVLLIGLVTVIAHAGTGDMVLLATRGGRGLSRGVQDLAFAAMFLGFAVKSPLWPLHSWLPDAHTEAPTEGSVLLAGVLLKLGTYGLIRIAVPELPAGAHDFAPVLAVLAGTATVWGALCCLAQRDLKRLVAYSSVGHMGFVLLAIATLTPAGLDAALLGNVAHGVVTGLLFFLAGAIKDRWHTLDITELGGGLLAKTPSLGGLLTFAAVASLGLPGLAGFWGEVLAIRAAWAPAAGLSGALFRGVAVAALLATLLAAGYFTRLLARVAQGVVPERWALVALPDVTPVEAAAWAPLAVLTVALGVWPRLVTAVSHPVVVSLLGGGR